MLILLRGIDKKVQVKIYLSVDVGLLFEVVDRVVTDSNYLSRFEILLTDQRVSESSERRANRSQRTWHSCHRQEYITSGAFMFVLQP